MPSAVGLDDNDPDCVCVKKSLFGCFGLFEGMGDRVNVNSEIQIKHSERQTSGSHQKLKGTLAKCAAALSWKHVYTYISL